jgi:hypothetical protein
MDKETRNRIERATQAARGLLEQDFADQLEGVFDIRLDGTLAAEPGSHLDAPQRVLWRKLMAAVEHHRASGQRASEAVATYLREAAFTMLNRFVALKMLEARGLVQECISRGEQSAGFKEFCGLAPGLVQLPDRGYRLYIESLFDELSTEVKVLFDRRDRSSVLWPKRATFERLLEILNAADLSSGEESSVIGRQSSAGDSGLTTEDRRPKTIWDQDETIGWVYQFFNGQDERRKMREESQAPRNSRELAVRNQFFTPRYVVQFLTDNTLGRIWYEMRGTKTVLADQCEYMVRKPGESFAPRAKKDPRDLRVLDPACGSGHFLLYAFDLLLVIYEEAWADPESPKSEATGRTLAEDYPSLDGLRRAVPGLVLAHNLYGVDIDPRCAQIAQLALWMRAQKAYRDFGIGRAERPQIRRSNIVVAEPLVADEQIAKEFVAKLDDPELGRVFMSLVESLSLAGDLGLLLRVEKLVARQAMRGQTGDLFAPPEERIRAALGRFVREDASTTNTQRRLFADDAVQGVGLLSIAEQTFDVVLMNPPFGDESLRAKKDFEKAFPRTKNDVYAAFVERGIDLLCAGGFLGAITSRTGFYLSSFQKWREELLLGEACPTVMADLGSGVMDGAMVEAAAYCVEKARDRNKDTLFLRLLDIVDKPMGLRSCLKDLTAESTASELIFSLNADSFRSVPGTPFTYWLTDNVRNLFRKLPPLESEGRSNRVGLQTSDNFRFLRLWWEVDHKAIGTRCYPYAKGGGFSPYYREFDLVLMWGEVGRCIKAWIEVMGDTPSRRVQNEGYYFRPGLTYSDRCTGGLAISPRPQGGVFDVKGSSIFVANDDASELLAVAAITLSRAFRLLVAARSGTHSLAQSFQVGQISSTPFPNVAPEQKRLLAAISKQAWSIRRTFDVGVETSHAFNFPQQLVERFNLWNRGSAKKEQEELQWEIDKIAFELYGLDADDQRSIGIPEDGLRTNAECEALDDGGSDSREEGFVADERDALRSWLVGVTFRHFDPRLATGERAIPPEPEPFDPLPSRSPGMYPEGEEPPDRPDILVDDEGHPDDLAARAQAVAERVKVDVPENLRGWLAKDFFPLHIRMYSKSRRKAPIYWQLATPSSTYSVWLYVHAFSKDTLFRVQNDYVAPKLAHEERRLEALTTEQRDGATPAQRKALAEQQALVEELRAFLAEVKRVAPIWNPDLDDGVIINFAPLWRLVPQNKSWQKELKTTWDALCEGKYDWAHLAIHLWPERVAPKCATDRSLAIAHGLESVFWEEGDDRKWQPRKVAQSQIDELIAERTSAAVKDALRALLDAPAPVASRGGGRGPSRRGSTRRVRSGGSTGPAVAAGPDPAALEAVRQAIAAGVDGVSKSDVVAATGLTDAQWNAAIDALLSAGTVTKSGAARGTRYHVVSLG